MEPRSVADALAGSKEPGEQPQPNPDAASEAIEHLTFTEQAPKATELAPPPPKPKRRTKAELEAEVARLQGEVTRQQEQAAANAPDVIAAMSAPLALSFKAAGGIMASWKGEHWNLAEQEAKLLGDAWAPVVGPLLAKHPEAVVWAAAIGVTYSVAYPRIQQDKTNALREKERRELEVSPTGKEVAKP